MSTGAQDEDDLLNQWAFLDQMVSRQATRLRETSQDDEEEDAPAAPNPAFIAEAEALRARVSTLEKECASLGEQLSQRTLDAQQRLTAADAEVNDIRQRITALQTERDAAVQAARAAQQQAAELQTQMAATAAAAPPAQPRRWWRR